MKCLHYQILDNGSVQCLLCPHQCRIKEGKAGICRVRVNENGKLVNKTYGKICSLAFDPIEKKPLYHFYPGRPVLSIGSVGCNFRCDFCQNWEISQSNYNELIRLKDVTSVQLLDYARSETGNIGIAYTYNEPYINFEFVLETAEVFKEAGLKNIMVSNGFYMPEPLQDLLYVIDAFNIDLKAFNNDFYKKITGGSLKAVLETIRTIARSDAYLEITHLVVTGLNDRVDEFQNLVKWISGECGSKTVLHLSRYFPHYKLSHEATPVKTLEKFYEIATKELSYVYLGNMITPFGQNTYCPGCGALLIKRTGYFTSVKGLGDKGICRHCGYDTEIIHAAL